MPPLPSHPVTRDEAYLAAILEELRALRATLAGGGQAAGSGRYAAPTVSEIVAGTTAEKPPTKRTRTRAPRNGTD